MATASFLSESNGTDLASWITNGHGPSGWDIPNHSTTIPASVTGYTRTGGSLFTWVASSADARAVQKLWPATDRIASTIFTASSFTIDFDCTTADTVVGLYFLDWDSIVRRGTLEVMDRDNADAVLLTKSINFNFNGGYNYFFEATGHVRVKVTYVSGGNVTLSGLFFDDGTTYPDNVRVTKAGAEFLIADAVDSNIRVTTAGVEFLVADAASTEPDAPSDLTATATGDSSILLEWTASAGATSYKIERAPDVAGSPGTYVEIATGVTGTTYTDTGRSPGTKYHYRIRATNAVGDSAYSNVAFATTDDFPADADLDTLTVATADEFNDFFTGTVTPSTIDPDATGIQFQVTETGVATYTSLVVSLSGLSAYPTFDSADHFTLTVGASGTWRARLVSGDGAGSWSATDTFTLEDEETTVPDPDETPLGTLGTPVMSPQLGWPWPNWRYPVDRDHPAEEFDLCA